MRREAYSKLLEWKNKKDRKPLILNGARQVGKTWLLKEFGNREYENLAYVSCDRTKNIGELFRNDHDAHRILLGLSAITGVDIKPEKTLVVIDEVQETPEAITALKYFCEDAPEFHVAVAGSLLGLFLHEGFSFPVGKIDMIRIFPMTFAEFLEAKGRRQLIRVLASGDEEMINTLHSTFVDELRQYYFTGGMPAVVKAYANGEGPAKVREIQKLILYAYENDFSKHTNSHTSQRISMVWRSIAPQLAKDNKRFIYGAVKGGARASDFELAIEWLINAGLAYRINRISQPVLPLKFYEDMSAFKLFVLDCGLLGAMTDTPASQILLGDNAFKEYKGLFTELFVLQQLMAAELPVYYFSSSDSRVEIDFIVQCGAEVYPLEVKAETNLRSKSLRTYIKKYPELKGIRASMSPFKDEGWMKNIPLYALSYSLKQQNMLSM